MTLSKARLEASGQVKLTVTAPTGAYLDQLVELGYGRSHTEVLQYLLRRSLDDLLRDMVLRKAAT
jgi:hypothetical protein